MCRRASSGGWWVIRPSQYVVIHNRPSCVSIQFTANRLNNSASEGKRAKKNCMSSVYCAWCCACRPRCRYRCTRVAGGQGRRAGSVALVVFFCLLCLLDADAVRVTLGRRAPSHRRGCLCRASAVFHRPPHHPPTPPPVLHVVGAGRHARALFVMVWSLGETVLARKEETRRAQEKKKKNKRANPFKKKITARKQGKSTRGLALSPSV